MKTLCFTYFTFVNNLFFESKNDFCIYKRLYWTTLWATEAQYEPFWSTMIHYDQKYSHCEPLWLTMNHYDPTFDKLFYIDQN